jgi:hypothetical protein
LNKRFGPTRKSQCSYGFIISEPFDQERVEAHRGTKCRINKADGEKYVDETIRWVIQAVGNGKSFGIIEVDHVLRETR